MTVPFPEPTPRSPFPPIADYAFLSDCHVTALVAPSGAVEWMCVPRVDSGSIFGALLDRDSGTFRLGPADVAVPAARRYLPGTMVLETTWMSRSGWLVVRDALLMGPWHHEQTHESSHRRPPMASRRLEGLRSSTECSLRLRIPSRSTPGAKSEAQTGCLQLTSSWFKAAAGAAPGSQAYFRGMRDDLNDSEGRNR